jgi:hypothetical protein
VANKFSLLTIDEDDFTGISNDSEQDISTQKVQKRALTVNNNATHASLAVENKSRECSAPSRNAPLQSDEEDHQDAPGQFTVVQR